MFSPLPLERAGTLASQPGPYFFEEIGERTPGDFAPWTPAGERVSFPHTPFLWTVVKAAWFFYRPTWPAASKTNASWPAHQLGRAGEVVYCREEKVGTRTVTLCLSQRVPTYVPSPPSRWAGRYGPFAVRAAGQVISEKYSLPTQPPPEGARGGTSSQGFFSPFLPKKWGPGRAGQGSLPVPTAKEKTRTGAGSCTEKRAVIPVLLYGIIFLLTK